MTRTAPSPPVTTGLVLSGRYRLEEPLGSGATAAVWRGRDLDLGRPVAVKVLLDAGVAPELAARFEREGVILGRLDHPNLARVLAGGQDGERSYLVMELVEGVSLATVLQEGPLPVERAVGLAADVAAGLAAAHRAGVVHRDVKPANVVCGTDGVPRLVDFGIARVEDLTTMTRADVVLGTAAYLSPEQAQGHTPGPPSDVYALGCVLYELLTGQPPFVGDSALAVAYQHVHDRPVPPGRRVQLPEALSTVVLRCLAKDPNARYLSAAELEHDLRRSLTGEIDASTAALAVVDEPREDTIALPHAVDAGDTSAGRDPRRLVLASVVGAIVAALVMVTLADGRPGSSADADGTTTTSVTTTTTTTTVPPPTSAPAIVDPTADDDGGQGQGRGKAKGNNKDDD